MQALQYGIGYIPIVLVKEYAYCPRIFYYKYYMYMEPPTESMRYPCYTYQTLYSIIREYGLEGDLYLEYPVYSRLLGVSGRVDAVVLHDDGTYSLIEVKYSVSKRRLETSHRHLKIQLIAYMIACEETLGLRTRSAYMLSLDNSRLLEVRIRPWEIVETIDLVENMWKIITDQRIPDRTSDKWKCRACHYRKICW